jgi:transcription elongation GreA/GreB family factor
MRDASVKARLVEVLRKTLEDELSVLRASAAAARDGATHEDAKAEHQYDTRALELSYLAGAQIARVERSSAALTALDELDFRPVSPDGPISVGSAVRVEDVDGKGEARNYLLSAVGGGNRLRVDGNTWQVLSPSSPLGKALLGKRLNDVVPWRVKGTEREFEIVEIF